MDKRTKATPKGWSIKQEGQWFKVYDKDNKFRTKFPMRSQADAYIEAHQRGHHATQANA